MVVAESSRAFVKGQRGQKITSFGQILLVVGLNREYNPTSEQQVLHFCGIWLGHNHIFKFSNFNFNC